MSRDEFGQMMIERAHRRRNGAIIVVDNNESWEDGEADDNQTDNDDVTFE